MIRLVKSNKQEDVLVNQTEITSFLADKAATKMYPQVLHYLHFKKQCTICKLECREPKIILVIQQLVVS